MRQKVYNPAEDFNYSYDGRSLVITGWKEKAKEYVFIPPEIDGHPVTAIGNGAFQFCHALKQVSVPDSVTVIENAAFKGCESLEKAELSSQLGGIGAFAFQGCVSLRELTISNHVTRMELNSFRDCTGVETIHVKLRESKYGEVRSFAVASESEGALWMYIRAILRACDPNVQLMDKYDATFLELQQEDDRYRVATFRLSDPYNMTRQMRKIYRDCLIGMMETIIKTDRVDRLTKLGELNCINPALLSEYIDMAGRIGGGCIAYLLEFQNRRGKSDAYDYSL